MALKRIMKLLTYIILSFPIIQLVNCSSPAEPEPQETDFGIFFLQNESLKIDDIQGEALSQFELNPTPWISANDIEFYDWSSHCIYLKEDKSKFFPDLQYYYVYPDSWKDRPFIFVGENTSCYAGFFEPHDAIYTYLAPYISFIEISLFPDDIVTSDWPFLNYPDPRNNQTFKDALIKKDLFHEGIEVTMGTTDDTFNLIFGDSALTIEYTVQITNMDSDDLYVFDPGKVNHEHFYYYNNGPTFQNISSGQVYYNGTNCGETPDAWSSDWYTLLKSGESISRRLVLDNCEMLSTGQYQINLWYNAPRREVTREIRTSDQGRYWLGRTQCDIFYVTIMEDGQGAILNSVTPNKASDLASNKAHF